jgi:hypothetical protein
METDPLTVPDLSSARGGGAEEAFYDKIERIVVGEEIGPSDCMRRRSG